MFLAYLKVPYFVSAPKRCMLKVLHVARNHFTASLHCGFYKDIFPTVFKILGLAKIDLIAIIKNSLSVTTETISQDEVIVL